MRWLDVKYGQMEDRRQWLKLHLMCGTKTNIVTRVEVSDGYSHDYHHFKPLVDHTAKQGFNLKQAVQYRNNLSHDQGEVRAETPKQELDGADQRSALQGALS